MGTRTTLKFYDKGINNNYYVYKHWDGYPSHILKCIKNSLKYSWKLPRFEADEFVTAFIAANKKSEGDIRYTSSHEVNADTEYRYDITYANGKLNIDIFKYEYDRDKFLNIFSGDLDQALSKFSD